MRVHKTASLALGLATVLSLGLLGRPAPADDPPAPGQDQAAPRIEPGAEASRPDAWITTKVKAKLIADDLLNGLDIRVSTSDGVVQLSGWVKEPGQMSHVVKIASGVLGVREVRNDLLIRQ